MLLAKSDDLPPVELLGPHDLDELKKEGHERIDVPIFTSGNGAPVDEYLALVADRLEGPDHVKIRGRYVVFQHPAVAEALDDKGAHERLELGEEVVVLKKLVD